MNSNVTNHEQLWGCSFCDKTSKEVRHLVAGPREGLAICDECVGQAVILLVSEGWIPVNAGLRVEGDLRKPPEPPESGEGA